ncbi:hypothetical protein CSKR_112814 [Clonorchis sinensis]|uniref:Uncharacterized protein n=1 Tax=Clonorchis sinensis TaxID=79923 RepID=A0A3R7CJE2_CLOSI|nr:hypothetical protein CSKR_112814 [Clonorchis sinensis]
MSTVHQHKRGLACGWLPLLWLCISFTKLNIPLLLERVFLNFLWIFIDCYSTASKCYKETPQIP